jgi:hypothetical protein
MSEESDVLQSALPRISKPLLHLPSSVSNTVAAGSIGTASSSAFSASAKNSIRAAGTQDKVIDLRSRDSYYSDNAGMGMPAPKANWDDPSVDAGVSTAFIPPAVSPPPTMQLPAHARLMAVYFGESAFMPSTLLFLSGVVSILSYPPFEGDPGVPPQERADSTGQLSRDGQKRLDEWKRRKNRSTAWMRPRHLYWDASKGFKSNYKGIHVILPPLGQMKVKDAEASFLVAQFEIPLRKSAKNKMPSTSPNAESAAAAAAGPAAPPAASASAAQASQVTPVVVCLHRLDAQHKPDAQLHNKALYLEQLASRNERLHFVLLVEQHDDAMLDEQTLGWLQGSTVTPNLIPHVCHAGYPTEAWTLPGVCAR